MIKKIKDMIPDSVYLKIRFKKSMGYPLNLKEPKTFNEKLQWLKLYNRNPEYTTMVDKYAVKKYISEKIGAEYIIPTLGVWNSFDEIDFDALPDQSVNKVSEHSLSAYYVNSSNWLAMSFKNVVISVVTMKAAIISEIPFALLSVAFAVSIDIIKCALFDKFENKMCEKLQSTIKKVFVMVENQIDMIF